jgi:hypothetical protein
MRFYSIRVVEADNRKQAIEKVINQEFMESDSICDKVLSECEVIYELSKATML